MAKWLLPPSDRRLDMEMLAQSERISCCLLAIDDAQADS